MKTVIKNSMVCLVVTLVFNALGLIKFEAHDIVKAIVLTGIIVGISFSYLFVAGAFIASASFALVSGLIRKLESRVTFLRNWLVEAISWLIVAGTFLLLFILLKGLFQGFINIFLRAIIGNNIQFGAGAFILFVFVIWFFQGYEQIMTFLLPKKT